MHTSISQENNTAFFTCPSCNQSI
uniref:Uncharacterized protein n=1 Tax=Rhizophora mucronata TaxID=61149 RepID=A0A2P2QID9_RHIMU